MVAVVLVLGAVAVVTSLGKRPGSERALNIGLIVEPTNLNIRETAGVALDQVLIDNVYQGLVGLQPGTVNEYRPVLATDMPEVSADGRVYEFKLRSGVKFHSGNPLHADDVVHSLTQTLTEDTIGQTPTVEAVSDTEVRISLEEPYSQLLWQLASRPGLITEEGGDANMSNTANGTGPYTLQNWRQNDSITLSANDNYWGDPATVQTVVFQFVPDSRAAVNALREGSLDVHTALLPTLRQEFENSPDITLKRAASTDVFTLAYNQTKAPFNDLRVRQALSQAIDTDAIIASQQGDGKALGSPITELEPGYADLTAMNAYDPENARQLLAEAGVPNLSLTITAPNIYDPAALDIITSQLAQVGVTAKVEPVEFGVWLERVYSAKDYDLSFINHAEPADFVNYTNPDYYFGYDSKPVQELYAQSLLATDQEQAAALLQKAAEQVAQDAPAKWLYNYTPTLAINNDVAGFPESNTNSRLPLEGVTISE